MADLSAAERRLAEARDNAFALMDERIHYSICMSKLDALIAAARLAERDRLLEGQYDADLDPRGGPA